MLVKNGKSDSKGESELRSYIIKRIIQAFAVCLVISMLSFFLLFLNTDPALLLLPPEAEVEDIMIFKFSHQPGGYSYRDYCCNKTLLVNRQHYDLYSPGRASHAALLVRYYAHYYFRAVVELVADLRQ